MAAADDAVVVVQDKVHEEVVGQVVDGDKVVEEDQDVDDAAVAVEDQI